MNSNIRHLLTGVKSELLEVQLVSHVKKDSEKEHQGFFSMTKHNSWRGPVALPQMLTDFWSSLLAWLRPVFHFQLLFLFETQNGRAKGGKKRECPSSDSLPRCSEQLEKLRTQSGSPFGYQEPT